jgi:hypothetical protein
LNQREQLKHIRELITDVEHQTQLATEEQDVVKQTNNEHTAHNFEQYNLLLEWLDGRTDLLERLLTNTELNYTSIRKWAAARTNKDERRKKKYYIQRGEHKQHVEVLQGNIDEHQGRIPSVTLLPEEQPVTEGTESSDRPTTPTRRRTWSIPGGYLNVNEQEESIQQTTKQASHQKNKGKKNRTQRKKDQTRRKKTNEQQRKRTTTCQNQTQEISRSLKESGSQTQRPLQVMAKIEVQKESTLGSIEFKIRLK